MYLHFHYLSIIILSRIKRLKRRFISSGKKEALMRSIHLGNARRNFFAILSITFSLSPDCNMAFTESFRRSLRFLPFSVRASSSGSSGMTSVVESRS